MAQDYTKEEAAKYLGISVRTLLRLTGKEVAHLPKRRKSDPTLYSNDELDRYKQSLTVTPYVSSTVTPDTQALAPFDQQPLTAPLLQSALALVLREVLPPAHAELLSISEAAQRLGLPVRVLNTAVDAGELPTHFIPGQQTVRSGPHGKYKLRGRVRTDDLQRWFNRAFPPMT